MFTDLTVATCDELFEEALEEIKKLVSIESVYRDSFGREGAPFGKEIRVALEATLELAGRLGFKTYIDPDGYYGYAEIGEGEKLVGILGHVDVVSPGDLSDWDTPPYVATIVGEKLHGRGTIDDKGPIVAALYGVKALMETGHEFESRVRFIFGTDEETLWRGIDVYKEKEEIPSIAFTPDSTFPVIYAEKGLYNVKVVGANNNSFTFNGGESFNVVPGKALYPEFEIVEEALIDLGFKWETKDGMIEVSGKSVHAKDTPNGTNAIALLFIALAKSGETNNAVRFISEITGLDPYAEKLITPFQDEHTGKLTCNVGKVKVTETDIEIMLDIRIPASHPGKQSILRDIQHVAEDYGLHAEEFDYLKPVFADKSSLLVQTLWKTYRDHTEDFESQPIASGGTTYAKAMDNCLAFGPKLPGREKTEHQPNEHIYLSDIRTSMIIYSDAIARLTGLKQAKIDKENKKQIDKLNNKDDQQKDETEAESIEPQTENIENESDAKVESQNET